jgi:hypothetical protein
MGIRDRFKGYKKRRQTEKELSEFQNKEFEREYKVRAKQAALIAAREQASEKALERARARKERGYQRLLRKGKEALETTDRVTRRGGEVFQKAALYGTPPRPRPAPPIGYRVSRPAPPVLRAASAPIGQNRRFVEIGDTRQPTEMSSSLMKHFEVKRPETGGSNLENAFFGSPTGLNLFGNNRQVKKNGRKS